jgi:alpha-N-arabinofuranosidase
MQWNTNLIGYDALHSFGSASYYAQVMLAQNKGDVVLPARLGELATGANADTRALFATATLSKADNTVLVKVVNAGDASADIEIRIEGPAHVEPNGTAIVLAGDPAWVNTLDEPRKVAPQQEAITNAAPSFHRTFPPHSFTILRLKVSAQ